MRRALARTGEFLILLAAVAAITFLAVNLLPGDPARLFAGEEATFEEIEAVRRRMGLDRPLPVQFARYVLQAVQGDLGTSIRSGRPVASEIGARIGTTLRLCAMAIAVAAAIALPLGVLSAGRPNSLVVQALDWAGLIVLSVPVYWLGLALILVFALNWRLFPAGGDGTAAHFVLPAIALGAHTGVAVSRVLRASLADVMNQPYLTVARGKGLTAARTLWAHALPNALGPAVAYFALETGRLLGGAVLTETVFSINGLGRFIVQSIAFRDYPCVVGTALVMALGVLAANLAGDLACSRIDPRL